MNEELPYLLALTLFALSTAGTPGPNNLMLTASGANYGFVKSIPHMAGILAGFAALLLAVAAGLGSIFELWPLTHTVLKTVGSAYLFYLAWKIASSDGFSASQNKNSKPLTFWQAACFQFVNPKAWIMCITAVSTFAKEGEQYGLSALLIAGIYTLIMINTLPIWTLFGKIIAQKLKTNKARIYFNYCMGGLTAASVMLILF